MCHYIWQYGSATLGGDIWFSCWSDHEKTIFGAIEEAIYLLNRNDLSKSKWAGEGLPKCGPAVLQVKSSVMALVWRVVWNCEATKQQLWENSDRVCHLAVKLILHCPCFHYWGRVRSPHGCCLIIAPPLPPLPSSFHTKEKGGFIQLQKKKVMQKERPEHRWRDPNDEGMVSLSVGWARSGASV